MRDKGEKDSRRRGKRDINEGFGKGIEIGKEKNRRGE
jgi:hypothetical protein